MALDPKTGLAELYSGAYAPPNGPTTIPGYKPNYNALIQGDPIYNQLGENLGAESISDRAGLTAARRRGYIQFGADYTPDASLAGSDFGADIDETTRQLARTNTAEGLSITGQIDRQHQDNITALKNALAARGLLRSGATGKALGREEQDYKVAQSEARLKVADYFAGVQAAFNAAERARSGQRTAGLESAYGRVSTNPANAPTPARTLQPTAIPNVYTDSSGALYNPDGTPWKQPDYGTNLFDTPRPGPAPVAGTTLPPIQYPGGRRIAE